MGIWLFSMLKLNTDALANYNFPLCNKNHTERLWYISEPNSEACYTDYESATTQRAPGIEINLCGPLACTKGTDALEYIKRYYSDKTNMGCCWIMPFRLLWHTYLYTSFMINIFVRTKTWLLRIKFYSYNCYAWILIERSKKQLSMCFQTKINDYT